MTPRILIAEDHRLVAELYSNLLQPKYSVVGIVTDALHLLREAERLQPDLVITDISMPRMSGLDAVAELRKSFFSLKILVATVDEDPSVAAEAFRRGANGYFLKIETARSLLIAVEKVLMGNEYLSEILSRDEVNILRWEARRCQDKSEILSNRQLEVLQLLAEGKTAKQMAHALHLSVSAIADHKRRMLKAIGAHSTADLVKHAVRLHLVST